jgi:hypothetical protein
MIKISIRVHPSARKSEVLRFENGVWHIKVAAPPVEGKANKALIEFLSELLGVSKSRITIKKGATSHHKLIGVEGLAEEDINKLLQPS